jgi:glutaminyl-tRNA synthetase
VELHCAYDPQTRGGNAPDGRRAKVTLHWVSAAHAVQAEVRLYDTLFLKENPDEVPAGSDFTVNLNPKSLEVLNGCYLEPSLKEANLGERFQFERMGYFCTDSIDSSRDHLVFNRIVTLKDEWEKIQKAQGLK